MAALRRWLPLAVIGAVVVACGAGSGETPTPTATAVPPTATAPGDEPLRWGYNPLQATGEHDSQALYNPLPLGYRIETVLSGLDRPTQLAAIPDGRLLVTEQAGTVRVVQDGRLLDEPFFAVDVYLPQLDGTVELGLVGIAIDPEFDEQPYVYLSYAADNPRRTVIARVRDEGGRGVDLEEILSWEAAPICCHIGGGMTFAPDGTLFIGAGDHGMPNVAQDPTQPPGSILRINRDGSIPPDNPFGGPVYAYGLRNPYDVAIDPETGRIFAGENGFFGQDAVVEIKAGANYGWLVPASRVAEEEIEDPLIFYHNSYGMAGMEFYSSDVLSELQGRLFFCQFNSGGAVRELELLPNGAVGRDAIRAPGCTTGIATGADGFLYFLNYVEGTLSRIARAEE